MRAQMPTLYTLSSMKPNRMAEMPTLCTLSAMRATRKAEMQKCYTLISIKKQPGAMKCRRCLGIASEQSPKECVTGGGSSSSDIKKKIK
jgi:hypothetical protein